MVMALIARIYRADPDERRRAPRYPVEADATLRAPDGRPLDVLIYELSMTGFRMETPERLDPDATFSIGIAGIRVDATVASRRGPTGYGCEFVAPITFYQLTEALEAVPSVVELGARERRPPRKTMIAGIRPRRLLFAAIATGAFILCVVSLWPF
jgi:hypothetical protein